LAIITTKVTRKPS